MPANHRPQLDSLRVFAVGAVACHHWILTDDGLGRTLGRAGVGLFFVLSGYLVTGILLEARKKAAFTKDRWTPLRAFFARRALRIFPLYYGIILLGVWLNFPEFRQNVAWLLLYATNFQVFLTERWPGEISHFWSLGVEEQFYLFWPWFVLFLPMRYLRGFFLAAMGLGIAFRVGLVLTIPSMTMADVLPVGSLDALAGGALLAYWGVSSPAGRTMCRFCVALGLPIVVVFQVAASTAELPAWIIEIRQFALTLAFVALIGKASVGFRGATGWLLERPVLMSLGKVSYGLYVLHNLMPEALYRMSRHANLGPFESTPWGRVVAMALLSVAAAYVSWYAWERPCNELKRFFPYTGGRRPGHSPSRAAWENNLPIGSSASAR